MKKSVFKSLLLGLFIFLGFSSSAQYTVNSASLAFTFHFKQGADATNEALAGSSWSYTLVPTYYKIDNTTGVTKVDYNTYVSLTPQDQFNSFTIAESPSDGALLCSNYMIRTSTYQMLQSKRFNSQFDYDAFAGYEAGIISVCGPGGMEW